MLPRIPAIAPCTAVLGKGILCITAVALASIVVGGLSVTGAATAIDEVVGIASQTG